MRRAGRVLTIVVAAAALMAVLPLPTFPAWVAHLVVLELATALVVLGLTAAGLGGGRWRLAALLATAVHAWPVAAAVPLYVRVGAPFSVAEHVGWWRRDVRVTRDVVLEPSRPDLRVDIYEPRSATRKLLVVVHGGSWRGGDKGTAPHVSEDLAARGWRVADVTYRLAPWHRFPAAVEDVKCLAGRLRERFQPQEVSYLGRSAGGEIALVAASDTDIRPACAVEDSPPHSVIAVYAPTDLAWGHANPVRPDVVDGPRSLELYLGGTPAVVPDAYRRATPQSWPRRARVLLIHGTGDRLVRGQHAQRFAAREPRAEVLLIPGADHGFDVRRGGVGEQLARAAIRRFLSEGPVSVSRSAGS